MIQFLTTWRGYEFGDIRELGGQEAALIAGGIARAYTVSIDKESDKVAVLRYDANGQLVGLVAENAAGAEIVVSINGASAIPTPPAAAKVLKSTGTSAGAYSWQDETAGAGGTPADGSITTAKLAEQAANTLLGRASTGIGPVSALTSGQAKTALQLAKADVGLGSVDNTADASKPVSAAQASAIATAKTEAISQAKSDLLGGAPAAALDTLKELSDALGGNANVVTNLTASVGTAQTTATAAGTAAAAAQTTANTASTTATSAQTAATSATTTANAASTAAATASTAAAAALSRLTGIRVDGVQTAVQGINFNGFEAQVVDGVLVITAGGAPQIDPVWTEPATKTDAQAARFLHQTGWGSNPTLLSTVKTGGMTAYLDSQLAVPITQTFRQWLDGGSLNDARASTGIQALPRAWYSRTVYGNDKVRMRCAWAMSQIWVCSRSGSNNFEDEYRLVYWADAIRKGTFGQFRTMMDEITRSHAMSLFLTYYLNNGQSVGSQPDENYAREILQLFTIGKYELNIDGSHKKRSDLPSSDPRYLALGTPGADASAETYTNVQIQAFAKVFTGLGANQIYAGAHAGNPRLPASESQIGQAIYGGDGVSHAAGDAYWSTTPGLRQRRAQHGWGYNMNADLSASQRPLSMWGELHSLDSKTLFGGTVLPAYTGPSLTSGDNTTLAQMDAYGSNDIQLALDNIFNHPNVGPFIAEQCIRFTVTSNPSRAYVARVARKFNNDGSGVRGNMAAVWRQVFLDVEARDDSFATNPANNFGRMREMNASWLNSAVTFQADDVDEIVSGHDTDEGTDYVQNIGTAPSVFNWYRQDYIPPDLLLLTPPIGMPEAQMLHETSVIGLVTPQAFGINSANANHAWVNELLGTTEADTGGSLKDYTNTVVTNSVRQARLVTLIDRLSLHFCADQLSAETKTALFNATDSFHSGGFQYAVRRQWILDILGRLIQLCPEYRIQK